MRQFKRLAHSVWDCKYHIVWIPKYRRKASYGEKRKVIVASIKKWAQIKGIENQYHQYTGGIDSGTQGISYNTRIHLAVLFLLKSEPI